LRVQRQHGGQACGTCDLERAAPRDVLMHRCLR
jgi:hypothetical protein